MGRGSLEERGAGASIVKGLSAVSCAKMAETSDLPFGLWTRVGPRKHKFSRTRQSPGGANVPSWLHIANAIACWYVE